MLTRLLQRIISPYIALDGTEHGLWAAAASRTPFAYRWLGRSVSPDALDAEFGDFQQWLDLRPQLETSDRICPFTINPHTSAMRQGFVVIRGGKPLGGIITIVS